MRRDIAAIIAKPLFWTGVAFTLTGAWIFGGHDGEAMPYRLLPMFAFALLAVAARIAYPAAGLRRTGERLILFRAILELLQSISIVPGTCDVMDWGLDCLGIGSALLMLWFVRGIWLSILAIDQREPSPGAMGGALEASCEVIDMQEWQSRMRANSSAVPLQGRRGP